MLRELINFTEDTEKGLPQVHSWNIRPSNGLHIFLKMDTDKNFLDFDPIYYSEKRDKGDVYKPVDRAKIIRYETYGRRIGTNMNKAFHKKLFACNPFIVSFKKKNFTEIQEEDFNTFHDTAQKVAKLTEHEKKIGKLFIKEVLRLKNSDIQTLSLPAIIEDKKNGNHEKIERILSILGKEDFINFYLESFPDENGEVVVTDFKKYHDRYLNQKGFNKDDEEYKISSIKKGNEIKYVFHNRLFKKEKDTKQYSTQFVDTYSGYSLVNNYGISDYLNGLNSKKPYLEHKTAMFHNGISQYIDGEMAMVLHKFEQLVTVNRILPNPLPIIIWKENEPTLEEDVFLTEFKESIKIFKDKEIKHGFTEILKNLFDRNHSFKLSNFYLFNFAGGKLRDFDFVEKFQYKIEGLTITETFKDRAEKGKQELIESVFDFERKIVQPLFDNGLITEYSIEETVNKEKVKHKSFLFKYFDDLRDSNYKGNMFLLVTKYRKAFYDYIYKSKRDALNANIIKEILTVGLLDDIRHDEYRNNKHTNKYKIYRKLNIWFTLYDYFLETVNKNETMASKIEQFKDDLAEIIIGKRSLQDGEDELFAYVAGQVVFYIQSKSRSADKSYARLEPFLNKAGAKEFKSALKEEFAKYKHERYSSEFNIPFAQVNVYPLTQSMKDLLPFFLGGYFSKNQLFPGAISE